MSHSNCAIFCKSRLNISRLALLVALCHFHLLNFTNVVALVSCELGSFYFCISVFENWFLKSLLNFRTCWSQSSKMRYSMFQNLILSLPFKYQSWVWTSLVWRSHVTSWRRNGSLSSHIVRMYRMSIWRLGSSPWWWRHRSRTSYTSRVKSRHPILSLTEWLLLRMFRCVCWFLISCLNKFK